MGDGGANTFPSSINLLSDHAFEARTSWTDMPNNTATSAYADCRADNEESIKFGKNALFLSTGSGNASGAGVYQTVSGLSAGEYTFSAYLRAATDYGYERRRIPPRGHLGTYIFCQLSRPLKKE